MSGASDRTKTMAQVTFIHSSDLQLGMTRNFLDPDAQSRFDAARLHAVERLGTLASERDAEFIVVAGDVFEHNSLNRRTMGRALEVFGRLPVPVFLLPGNHDPLVADSIFSHTEDLDNVTVLADSTPVVVREGVEVLGAPLTAIHATEDLVAKALRGLGPTDGVRVLVGHGQVEAYSSDAADLIDLDNVERALDAGVIDYVALGDTHSTMSLGSSGRVWFSGSPEVTDFHDRYPGVAGGEINSGNALVVTLTSGGDCEVEEVSTGQWAFEALHAEMADEHDVEDFLAHLDGYQAKDRTVIKYSTAGTLGLAATRALEEGLAQREPIFAALYERTRLMDLHLEPGDDELEALPLQGFARGAMTQLVEVASSHGGDISATTRDTARDAVNLLFRLSQEA